MKVKRGIKMLVFFRVEFHLLLTVLLLLILGIGNGAGNMLINLCAAGLAAFASWKALHWAKTVAEAAPACERVECHELKSGYLVLREVDGRTSTRYYPRSALILL